MIDIKPHTAQSKVISKKINTSYQLFLYNHNNYSLQVCLFETFGGVKAIPHGGGFSQKKSFNFNQKFSATFDLIKTSDESLYL